MTNAMIFLALIVAIGITHGRYLLIQIDQDTTEARIGWASTYGVFIRSDKRTCNDADELIRFQSYPQYRCEEQCTSYDDCHFYFTSYDPYNYGLCIMYSSCSADQVGSLTGTTYEKLVRTYLVVSVSGVQGRYNALEDAKEALNGIIGGEKLIAEVSSQGILNRDPHMINGQEQTLSNGFNKYWCDWECPGGRGINPLMDLCQAYLDAKVV